MRNDEEEIKNRHHNCVVPHHTLAVKLADRTVSSPVPCLPLFYSLADVAETQMLVYDSPIDHGNRFYLPTDPQQRSSPLSIPTNFSTNPHYTHESPSIPQYQDGLSKLCQVCRIDRRYQGIRLCWCSGCSQRHLPVLRHADIVCSTSSRNS